MKRFWDKVEKTDTCWLWTAAALPTGYGCFSVKRRMRYAHRVSYEMHVGPIPEGHEIHHRCGRRGCVRPDHLEAVTRKEHRQRDDVAQQAARASAAARRAKTHCSNGHEFTKENTYIWRDERTCRACHRDRERARRARRAAA